jgi:hypothetical protein
VPRVGAIAWFVALVLSYAASAHAIVPTRLPAHTGQPATSDAGVTFLDFRFRGSSMSPVPPVINSTGTVAFLAHLAGPGVPTANDTSVWSTALTPQDVVTGRPLHLVQRPGGQPPGLGTGVLFSVLHSHAMKIVQDAQREALGAASRELRTDLAAALRRQ